MDALCQYLRSFPDAYPYLERVSICNRNSLSPSHLASLSSALPSLQSLPGIRLDILEPSVIPRNLKYLNVSFTAVLNSLPFPEGLEVLRLRPLTPLACHSFWSTILPSLPLGLQHLSVKAGACDAVYPLAEDIALLPRGLRQLALNFEGCYEFSTQCLSALPPHLEVLELHNSNLKSWERDDYAAAKALPRTLTKLNFGDSTIPSESAPWLPPSLTSITPFFHLDPKDWNTYLPKLQRAYLGSSLESALPASITDVTGNSLDHVERYALPLGLNKLTLEIWYSGSRLEHFENLPPLLLDLTLRAISLPLDRLPIRLTRLDFSQGDAIWELTPSECKSLPRSLTSLDLRVVKLQPSGAEVLSRMPPHLEKLSLTMSRFEAGCLKTMLCSKLRELDLGYREIDSELALHDLCTSLPRRLAIFRLEDAASIEVGLTDESLMNLPPGLCLLHLSFHRHKDALIFDGTCKRYLPKTLTNLRLHDGEIGWWDGEI